MKRVALACALLLAACTSPEERQRQAAEDDRFCRMSTKPGTDAYLGCLASMQVDTAAEAAARAEADEPGKAAIARGLGVVRDVAFWLRFF